MKRRSLYLLLAVLSFLTAFSQNHTSEIPVQELHQKLRSDIQILDVRTPEEWQSGIIRNAVTINYYATDFSTSLRDLNKEKPVYVYCAVGGRSAKAVRILKDMGFKQVYNITGGIISWKEAGYELLPYKKQD